MHTHRFVNLIIVLILCLSTAGSLANPTTTATAQGEVLNSQYVIARVYYGERSGLEELASELDIWEVNHAEGYLVAMLSTDKVEQLRQAGYGVEIDPVKTEQINQPLVALPGQGTDTIPSFPCYRTVLETYADLGDLAAANPGLVDLTDIGDSWDKVTEGGPGGFDLLMLRITNESRSEKYGRFMLIAEVHAREYVTSETVLRMAEHLVSNYGIDPEITWMLDYFEIYILPMSNPDGRIFTEDDEEPLLWRKNTDNDDGCTTLPSYGTDLNRNNGFHWNEGGSSDDPCNELYHGPEPDSEPETQAIQAQVLALFPDQRGEDDQDAAPDDTTGLFISIHSYSELVLWPWGFTETDAPNHKQLQTLGRKMAYFNKYAPSQAVELYPTTGTNDDWTYGTLGIASYTFEMGTDFFQDCATFESTIYPDNLQALLNGFKAARRPYQNPAGPETLELTIPAVPILPGTPVEVTGRANDTRYYDDDGTEPTQNIAAARYSIDNPSWVSGTLTYPMTASDGVFNATSEAIRVTIDTSGLTNGRHMVFVESQDEDGNWGYTSAAFLDILDPETAPHIVGTVRDASTNEPVAATISTGAYQTSSDPVSGAYDLLVYSGTYTLTASAPYYVPFTVTGLAVEDGQTLQQDFTLTPMCPIFDDDVEQGNLGWTAQAPWAITDEASHSPSHSWTDSPGGNYANNKNTSLTSPIFNLQNWEEVGLTFWHTYDIQITYDSGIVEYSTDGGTTWVEAARFDGIQTDWSQVSLNLPALAGSATARIRFRLQTNNLIYRDGWHIDDIQLMGSGACTPTCIPITSILGAAIEGPIHPGEEVEFSFLLFPDNFTPPYTFSVDFGDGSFFTNSSSDNPFSFSHVFEAAGDYRVESEFSNCSMTEPITSYVTIAVSNYQTFLPMLQKNGIESDETSSLPARQTDRAPLASLLPAAMGLSVLFILPAIKKIR